MRRFPILLMLILYCGLLRSQSPGSLIAVRYSSAYNRNFIDVFSSMNNLASLAEIAQVELGVCSERLFMTGSVNANSLVLALPAFDGSVGIEADYSGIRDYTQTNLGLAYAKKLGERIRLGIQFNYYSAQIPGYGSASTIYAQLGAICALTEKLRTGFQVCNPYGGKFGLEEKIPFTITNGWGFEFSDRFCVSAEFVKEESQDLFTNFLLQYRFQKQFFARIGVTTVVNGSLFGLGYAKKTFRIEIATSFHQQLGFSPAIFILYQFKKGEKK